MYSNPVNTQEDALNLVRRYRLDLVDFGGGSARGFAAWAFNIGREMLDVQAVADAIIQYKQHFVKTVRETPNLEEEEIRNAASLAEHLRNRAEERAELAQFIRSVQWGPYGGNVWIAIAKLATMSRPAQQGLIGTWDSHFVDCVRRAWLGLHAFKGYLGQSLPLDYHAGECETLDQLLSLDIERFEATLGEAPPWSGKDEERSWEMRALHVLVLSDLFAVPAETPHGDDFARAASRSA